MLMRQSFGYPSPWRDMERLRRQMNRLFSDTPRGAAPGFPAMNVWANEDGVIVTAELPGIRPDQIDISVVGDTLTISGAREAIELEGEAIYHRRERGVGRFTRTFQLPFRVETDQVEAAFGKGVLSITLPRAESDKPKKIAIQAG